MPKAIAVMSGKGGVGKSSVAVAIATIISEKYRTALLDFDICGPSTTTALGTVGGLVKTEEGFKPLKGPGNLDLISFGSILSPSDAVIWRGPKKLVFLEMFFNSVKDYEYVVIDTPPGISEEHSFLADKDVEVVIVTTPQGISLSDAQRCMEFCLSKNMKILGLIENMSRLKCGCCGEVFYPFGSKGGKQLADEYEVPFLCELPMEPRLSAAFDAGMFAAEYRSLAFCKVLRDVVGRVVDPAGETDQR